MAAVTNNHKLSGLKQQFWRPEVPHESHWVKIKGWAGLVPSGGSKGDLSSCLSQARGCPYSLVCDPSLHPPQQLSSFESLSDSDSSASPFHPDDLPISVSAD